MDGMTVPARTINARPLTREAFADFGDVIETDGARHYPINGGKCERYHDLAKVEALGPGGHVLINIFRGTPYPIPLTLTLVERHPFGSQAFMPLSPRPFLVVVAPDEGGWPGPPRAFLVKPDGNSLVGINYHRNVWHHPLISLEGTSEFLIVDRGGEGNNLDEFSFEHSYWIESLGDD